MRLIDADAYIEEALSRIDPQDMYLPINIKEMILDKMPTVDAVTVIRCKDCVHFKQSKVLGNTCALTDNHVTKKDYCSKAERKENGK